MNDDSPKGPDYSKSLYLPATDFPMRAGLPQREPEILKRWETIGLEQKMREAGRRPAEIHAARRAALRQRQYSYRPCAQ